MEVPELASAARAVHPVSFRHYQKFYCLVIEATVYEKLA